MQELRFVAVSEDGSYAVLAVPGRSARYTLPIDERLRAVALGQTSRLAQYEIEVESPLRPKEIQARIRAGETAEEIADAAGLPVERVRWFEGPVLAERAYIATQAQTASMRRPGDSGPGPRLGDIVPERISMLGGDPEDAEWDSRKRGDGNWQVSLTFTSGGRLHVAEWTFDPRRRHVAPADEAAERLCLPESELPPLSASVPGEATVTPLAPRLGAVAGGGGMAGGGVSDYGSGGYGTAGGASGGARFRQDRPAPERYSADRQPAERPAPAPERYSQERYGQERHSQERHSQERHSQERHSQERYGQERSGQERYGQERYGHDLPAPEPQHAERNPGGYAPQPPTSYAPPPPPAAYTQPPRPPQPPAHTLRPGHGLVPMWDPPAWNPNPDPGPGRPVPPASQAPAAPQPELPYVPDPSTDLAFEDPEPVLAPPASSDKPPVPRDDRAAAPAATVQPVVAPTPVPAPEPAPAPKPATAPEAAPAPQPAAAAPVPTATDTATKPDTEPVHPLAAITEPIADVVAEPVAAEPVAAEPAQPRELAQPAASAPSAQPVAEPAAAVEVAPAPAQEPTLAQGPTLAEGPVPEAPVQAEAPRADEPAKAEEPAKADEPEQPAADEQSRPRPAKGAKAKGRRSSVPSWDEIMLGSSRQRD
jgi:hypothetical protein